MKACLKDLLVRVRADLRRAHKSLTIWFNGVFGSAVVALPFLQGSLPEMREFLPEGIYQYLMGVVVAGNILLRFKTSKGLAEK